MRIHWLDPLKSPYFPNTSFAMTEPDGLLAAGGALSPQWLIKAYQQGIFPWFNEGDPILWWSPSPRMVFFPDQIHISRSLLKALKKEQFKVTVNHNFTKVIEACSAPRGNDENSSTWISPDMISAYKALHQLGYAHSVEVWEGVELVGGLYGVGIEKVFFGESMFSRTTNGSKIALVHLAEWLKEWQYKLIDCQVYNDHLDSLGAKQLDREHFEQLLHKYAQALHTHPLPEWLPTDISRDKVYWSNLKLNHEQS